MNELLEVRNFGQRVWLDNLTRDMIQDGTLKKLIDEDGLAGITSNPTIFYKAIKDGKAYGEALTELKASALGAEQRYEALVIPDIQAACDLLFPLYQSSRGEDGYVSFEVSPQLGHDEEGTVSAAVRMVATAKRENLLIKIPATPEGIAAIRRLIATGHKINVTLIFSLNHYRAVSEAYLQGLSTWVSGGGDPRQVKSVASFFLSRIDTAVDKRLEAIGTERALALRGKAAIAVAKSAYQIYEQRFHGDAFSDLYRKGCRRQKLLWASTGTKNPAYDDVLYVESLMGPETITTVPDATLKAFRDHGEADSTLEDGLPEIAAVIRQLQDLDIDLETLGEGLQRDGLRAFSDSFDELLRLVA